MKKLALGLIVSAFVPLAYASALACDHVTASMGPHCCDAPAHWSSRHAPEDARLAITSQNGQTVLLMTDDLIAVQLSDRTLHKLRHKLRDAEDDGEDTAIAQVVKVAILSTVRSMLSHSAECSIRDLQDVSYRNGKLVFTTDDGNYVFSEINVSDQDVMEGFSERDARAFVREFHRVKEHLR